MDSGSPKVRFVKCPRCKQILPEFANIPVYKCGGCDLILRAKHLVAAGSTGSEEPYNKSEPAQNDVELTQKIEAINHLKDSSSDTSSNSGDNNETAGSSSQKDGMRRISADCKSIDLSGKKEISSLSTANVLEHNRTMNAKPEDSSQKKELDYKFENHDTIASSNELLPPSPSEITSSPDSVKRDEFGSSNQSVIDDVGCLDVLSGVHEKEEPAQVGEHREEQGNNYDESFRGARFSHEVTGVGKNSVSISYHSSQANKENYLSDDDHNQNLPLDSAPRRYAEKMDDAESVISDEVIDLKFSGALENLSKSPTTSSSRAYYSSLSSNGDEYDFSGPPRSRNAHLSRRTGVRPTTGAVSGEGNLPLLEARKSKIIINSTDEPLVRKMASNSSYGQFGSALSHCSDWNQDEQFVSRSAHGFQTHESGNYMSTSARGVDSAQSRMEVDQAGASRFLEKIPPYHENLTYIHHNGNASDQPQEIDADKMELIRKVQNLKDELNRLTIQRQKFEAEFSGVSSDQEPLPPYHGLYYPLHPHGAYVSRIGHQSRSSQLRFPGASNIRHHLECSCSHICSEDWQCQAQLPCDACYSKVLHYACPASTSNHSYSPSTSSKHRHVDHGFPPTFHNHNIVSAFAYTRPLGLDMERLYKKQQDRTVRHCRSIACAAPFIACYMCRKLLQLPADFLLANKRSHKLQCGACSNVLTFSLVGKNHIAPYSRTHCNYGPNKLDNGSNTDIKVNNGPRTSQGDVVSISDEYGLSFGKSYSTEREHPMMNAQRSDPDKGMTDSILAPSTSTKPVDRAMLSPELVAKGMCPASKVVSEYGEVRKLKKLAQRSSPLHRLMGYSSPSEVMNCPSNDPDSLLHVPSQNSKEYLAGEMTMRNRPKSMWHADVKLESEHLEIKMDDESPTKLKTMRDSPLDAHVKKGLKNMSHGLESMKQKVNVNGRVILEHTRKRVEEKAGPVHPGNYWYDYRAGFWGVMGKPCLGIIPPYIEEFGYPMAKDCAGGNTGILVNGRELHEEDLALLVSVGFPAERNKVYTIDATGRIIDDDSGEEIGRLDNFAPNIEKTGHGFGMLDPSQNASN